MCETNRKYWILFHTLNDMINLLVLGNNINDLDNFKLFVISDKVPFLNYEINFLGGGLAQI